MTQDLPASSRGFADRILSEGRIEGRREGYKGERGKERGVISGREGSIEEGLGGEARLGTGQREGL